jgi:hypothetical protein
MKAKSVLIFILATKPFGEGSKGFDTSRFSTYWNSFIFMRLATTYVE